MKCALCGFRFTEEEGVAACSGCLLGGSCNLIRCPNCGYDNPREPKLFKVFEGWRRRINGIRRKV
jgi:rubredoxin